ncbi:MAG TPA: glycosyltransferase family 1 protein [Acidobacteria bacterium]|nr:glycosyltransferase family 1 protein [Acidobacteriota bacterium]
MYYTWYRPGTTLHVESLCPSIVCSVSKSDSRSRSKKLTETYNMRIGVDGRELFGQPTGTGRYLDNLCREWALLSTAKECEIVVYTPTPLNSGSLGDNVGAKVTHRVVPGTGSVWWEQTALANQANSDHLDVFFGPSYSLPLRIAMPSVVTLHDISFFSHPEWFGWREGFRRRWLARQSITRAQTIITVSDFCKKELLNYLNVEPSNISVIYNGISSKALNTPSLPDSTEQIILYVGAVFNRRNLPTLISAFGHIARRLPHTHLVIVGPNRTQPRQDLTKLSETHGVADRIQFLSYVEESELAQLYRDASVFAFLSEYEGFGMTPLEALSTNVPALVGDTPVAREVYKGSVLYVQPTDVDSVTTGLLELLTNTSLRHTLLTNAKPVLAELTWVRAAQNTLDVLMTAVKKYPS